MKNARLALTALVVGTLGLTAFGEGPYPVQMRQTVTFTANKWQLVHLHVAPTGSADQVFANWPADTIGAYDADSFRRYEQWSAQGSTEGVRPPAMLNWHRGDPGASEFSAVRANTVYQLLPTQSCSVTVLGVPEAARLTWHSTEGTNLANYVGFSLQEDAEVDAAAYFDGCTAGLGKLVRIGGSKESGPTEQVNLWGGDESVKAKDGQGLAVEAKHVSDWSGVLYVTPQYGLDFGTNGVLGTVAVRNDGASARTVRIRLLPGESSDDPSYALCVPTLRHEAFQWRKTTVDAKGWAPFSEASIDEVLDPGETLTLQMAFDRVLTKDVPAGYVIGGRLEFTDADGATKMRTAIPVSAVADGGAWASTAWPHGLWVANVSFDRASRIVTSAAGTNVTSNVIEHDVAAGGTMDVRLPMLVRGTGNLRLLQRVEMRSDTNGAVRCFAGGAAVPGGLTFVRRLSTAFLPTDVPVVEALPDLGTGFGGSAVFRFTVAERSPLNPLYHAQHPLHDGLSADYKSAAPSGDTFDNYRYEVKPELFSVGNEIRFDWDDTDLHAWSPDETCTGTCTWTFSNLVKEGGIRVKGTFTMTRLFADDVTLK